MVLSCAAFGCENKWKLKKDLSPGEKNKFWVSIFIAVLVSSFRHCFA